MQTSEIFKTEFTQLYKWAFGLAAFTIFYNIAEGWVSTYMGYEDGSLALFGFGADSFIEVISGLGIAHMIIRIKKHNHHRDNFEKGALKITGFSFYILVGVLIITSVYNIWTGHNPTTTFIGVVISLISITVMFALMLFKRKVGNKLNSEAIISDAACTKVCIYMSIILLVSSAIYELTQFPYIDSMGTLGLSYFAFKEGGECFEKAKSDQHSCNHC